ncbi:MULTISPECIES: GNAT family N-acetyltransferase [Fictibacillus]|uniref:GNAT family N-acetyltransferase n=1 Tax=Fictibacillus TaxID=1329200 RepID=UPI001012B781|nr:MULTISPECIES: GNAT family N-acetyltransferase [Fictibacillus]MDM5201398.1 hypothetical protein [Fictibacillus enclensis]RXZ01258.1 hypothetical protein DMO16_17335 [Fictibacillus sp. S7]
MTIRLRAAMPHEARSLGDLVKQAGLGTDGMREGIGNYLVVENDKGETIGTVGLERVEKDGLLRSFVLKKEYSNEQIFLRLIQRILLYCKEKGVETLYLLTKAVHLFEPLSFRPVPAEKVPAHVENTAHYKKTAEKDVVLLYCSLQEN